jgi:hypothetical protein
LSLLITWLLLAVVVVVAVDRLGHQLAVVVRVDFVQL